MCIIIGNLLDNAIEGTQKLKEEERQIYLEMMLKVDNLFILIKNPCMEQSLMKKGGHFLTTKNEEGHGNGIIISKTCGRGMSGKYLHKCGKWDFSGVCGCFPG